MSNSHRIRKAALASVLLSTAYVPLAAAEENEEGWNFSVAPMYLWAKNIEGTASIGGLEAPLDLDFKDDILDNLDAAFAIHMEANKGNLTLYGEYNYAKLDPTAVTKVGPIEVQADVEFKDTLWEAGAVWAFADSGSSTWELLGAVRYAEQDVRVDLARNNGPGIIPLPNRIEGGDDWWQGVAGLRYTFHVTDRWSWRLRGDYGYGDSDNSSLHAIGFLDYRYRHWGSFFVGYRYLDTDFDNGRSSSNGYSFDGDQQGPVLGLNFYF